MKQNVIVNGCRSGSDAECKPRGDWASAPPWPCRCGRRECGLLAPVTSGHSPLLRSGPGCHSPHGCGETWDRETRKKPTRENGDSDKIVMPFS